LTSDGPEDGVEPDTELPLPVIMLPLLGLREDVLDGGIDPIDPIELIDPIEELIPDDIGAGDPDIELLPLPPGELILIIGLIEDTALLSLDGGLHTVGCPSG